MQIDIWHHTYPHLYIIFHSSISPHPLLSVNVMRNDHRASNPHRNKNRKKIQNRYICPSILCVDNLVLIFRALFKCARKWAKISIAKVYILRCVQNQIRPWHTLTNRTPLTSPPLLKNWITRSTISNVS